MTPGATTKVIGACCGLSAFVIAIVAGMAADNPLDDVLARAILSLLVGNAVGWIVGLVGERTVVEGVANYKSTRPIGGPSGGQGQIASDGAAGGAE